MLHQRIVELRKKNKLTQESLAKKIGVTRSALSQYELNIRQPDYDIVRRIADYFGVSTDYLLGRNEKPDRVAEPAGNYIDNIMREFSEHYNIDLSDEKKKNILKEGIENYIKALYGERK